MSAQEKYYQSSSKTDRVRCRVRDCTEPMVAYQNYERHLKRNHPEENYKDKRTLGQKPFSFNLTKEKFGPEEAKGKKAAEEAGMEKVDVEDGQETNTEKPVAEPAKVKKAEAEVDVEEGEETKTDDDNNDIRMMKRKRTEEEDLIHIEAKVDKVISTMKLAPPKVQDTVVKSINSKLDFVLANLKVTKTVDMLEGVVKEMKKVCLSEEMTEKNDASNEDIKMLLRGCKNVKEIESVAPEFQYNDGDQKVVCSLCKTVFKYDASGERGGKVSGQLSNLKGRLKYHLESASHVNALQRNDAKERINVKEETRNQRCGMNNGRTGYYLLSNGRPSSDFTQLLSMQHTNGCDIGDINHSTYFLKNFSASLSKAIQGRLRQHLGTRLPQTGCLPPAKIVEDGATYRHDTRHFIGLTTIFPGDEQLIQSVFVAASKGIRSDGLSTAKSMVAATQDFIRPEQYLGTSQDGANYLAHVGELVDKELGVQGFHDWDGTHAAATIETGMRNPKKPWAGKFTWLNDMIGTISKANRFINFGMEYERFFKVWE